MHRRTVLGLMAAGLAAVAGAGRLRSAAPSPQVLEINGRRVWVAAPMGSAGAARPPLVIGLHGGGGNAPGFIENSQLLAKAPTAGFIGACPEGTQVPFPQPGDHRIWNSGPEAT